MRDIRATGSCRAWCSAALPWQMTAPWKGSHSFLSLRRASHIPIQMRFRRSHNDTPNSESCALQKKALQPPAGENACQKGPDALTTIVLEGPQTGDSRNFVYDRKAGCSLESP